MAKFTPDLRSRALECPECGKAVIAEPKGFVVSGVNSEDDPGEVERWTLFACEKHHPILMVESAVEDYWEAGGVAEAYFDDDPYRMYPAQDRVLSDEIPVELRRVHDEARACIRAKAYTAAAVMSGRVLEGVCDLNNVKGRDLQSRLAKMKEDGLIDGRLWEWANALRVVRNAAAHFSTESISKQDAEDTVAFAESLLDYLYVLTARFNALQERRAKRSDKDDAKDDGS
jgi:hypothetical protein